MFDDFDDNGSRGDDFFNHTDMEVSLEKFKRLESEDSLFFSEDEIEALSYHFFMKNQFREQLRILEHGLYLYPNKVEFLIEKASVLCMENRFTEALECTLLAKDFEPYNAMIHKMEAEILCDMDRPEEADVCFRTALNFCEFEDDDFIIEIYVNYAQMMTQDKRTDRAIHLIEQALKRFPDHESLFGQLAMNFISAQQYEKAIEYFKKHIDKNPYSHLAWFHLGRLYELTNRRSLAMSAYEYSGLADSKFKHAFLSLAGLHENNNEFRKAIENYLSCTEPGGELYPYICIARCYLGLEEGATARQYLLKAKGLEDMLPEFHYLMGYSYLSDKEPLKALPYFNKVYKSDKDDFAALKGILSCYSELDRSADIERTYLQLKKDNREMILENWKELAALLYLSEMDALLEDVLTEVERLGEYKEELVCVLNVIRYDQSPSKNNKEDIISRLIHNFEDTLESVKLFCHELYDEDEDFQHAVRIYQNDNEEDEQRNF